MTRDEKALPGELLMRLLVMLMLAALWAALPFVRIGQGVAYLRRRQWAIDLAWCSGFALVCLFLLWIG